MNRIDNCFAALKKKGEKAFISFITAGDPDLKTTAELVKGMAAAGADIIELGVPFSDPLADGPTIQKSSQRSLKAGTTLAKILQMAAEVRQSEQVPLVLMSYYNPVLQFGLDRFVQQAVEAGIDGLIVPDLPLEECRPLYSRAVENNLHLIPLVAPTTTDARMKQIAQHAQGFVYCVSLTGVTGMRAQASSSIAALTSRVRRVIALPAAVGFGVSSPAQAHAAAEHCDAVIVGSAVVKTIEDNPRSPVEAVCRLTADYKAALTGGA